MIGDKPQKIIPPSGNVAAEFMQKLFLQTEQRIIAEITRKRNQGFVDYSEHATLRRVQQILRDMVDDSEQYVPKMVSYPFLTGKGTFKGYGSAEEIIQRTDAETRRLIEQLSDNLLGEITEAAATAYQSSADLITAQNALKAAENGKTLIGRHSPDIYRKNVLTGVLTTTATGAGPLTSVEAVARSIEKEGIPAFIDRAGRKWSLRDYGNMATRTTFRQAQTAAELTKDDHDLYEVLRHPAPCRVCAIYSGRVYSKSGTNPNYPSLAQAFGKIDPAGPDVLSNTYLNIHPSCLCVLTKYTEKGKTDEQIQRMRDKSSFEKNPPKGDPRTKKEIAAYRQKEKNRRELRADIKQWEKMREALGDKVPATFATFQKHKKLNDEKYKRWKELMSGQPKPPKTPTTPKAPKTPTAPKTPKAPNVPTTPVAPKAPAAPAAPKAPTAPKPKEVVKAPEPKPFVSSFKPAGTIAEAEKQAERFTDKSAFGALGVSYKGVSLDVANTVNKVIGDFYDEFDVGKFGGILAPAGNTKLGKLIEGASAGYSPIRNSFLLNRKTMRDLKTANAALLKERETVGKFLAHPERYDTSKMSKRVLNVLMNSRVSGRGTVPDTIEEVLQHELGHALEKPLRKVPNYELLKERMSKYAPKISGYASDSFSEYVAESFASYRKGENIIDPEMVKAFESLRRKKP